MLGLRGLELTVLQVGFPVVIKACAHACFHMQIHQLYMVMKLADAGILSTLLVLQSSFQDP